jgi:hypothetical protein
LSKHVLVGCDLDEEERKQLKDMESQSLISSMYVIHDEQGSDANGAGKILAGFINELTFRIAFEDGSIRDWADHLSYVGSSLGLGRPVYWTEDELSVEVRRRLEMKGREDDRWSKWSKYLP